MGGVLDARLPLCLAPPKISREPEEQRVQLGDTLKVKIPISGKGPFTFKIKKDDEPLSNSDHVRVQEFDDYILVTIPGSLTLRRLGPSISSLV